MLIVKYDRIDFFGNRIYTEDKKNNYSKDDLKRAFQFFNKDYNITLQIDSVIIFWDSLSEFENKIVFVRKYDGICGMNYTEKKTSFDKCKKEIYKRLG